MPQIPKIAKSKDVVQQALRDKKRGINTAIKAFISKVIGWKQGLNGRGSPTFSIPVSDIKEPLPSEVQSFQAELEANFAQLMHAANQIETDQATYSARKQKQLQEREMRRSQPKSDLEMEKPASIRSFIKKASASQQTGKLRLGKHEMITLLLTTSEEQERGLMFVSPPVPIASFIYKQPQHNIAFWMKHTPAPLDIVFALNGKVMAIRNGEPYSTAMVRCSTPTDLVIELDQGTCQKLGISEGDEVRLIT